jgi:serine/threonine protein kinase
MHRYERSLADLVDDLGPMDEDAVRAVGRALCTTLSALHDAGIVVCDLNPANVLIDELNAPFIFDFRAAVLRESERHPASRGDVQYMAPEAFNTLPLRASDVWSLACTLLEMHTGLAPWDSVCANHVIVAVGICGRAPEVPSTMPACDVIRRCFASNPVDRPSLAELAAALS